MQQPLVRLIAVQLHTSQRHYSQDHFLVHHDLDFAAAVASDGRTKKVHCRLVYHHARQAPHPDECQDRARWLVRAALSLAPHSVVRDSCWAYMPLSLARNAVMHWRGSVLRDA
jgi:hypothetical protein